MSDDANPSVSGPEKIYAPFTREQVVALNEWRRAGWLHPFTCGDRADHIGEGELVATTRGWICPQCRYEQDWAHAYMLRTPANPFVHLFGAQA